SVYGITNGLNHDKVLSLHESRDGSLWIGMDHSGGLNRIKGNSSPSLPRPEGLIDAAIRVIHEDRKGTVWVGTSRGLNMLQAGKGEFSAYTTRQGLFSDEIYEILEDDFGYFWMSCRTGIFRVSKKEFDELDQGKVKGLTCIAFGKADGLASVQCNGVAKPAGWKGKDGRLWFPTIRGVLAVESRIKTNDKPPPVFIEEVLADKKPAVSGSASKWLQEIFSGRFSSGGAITFPPGR